MFRSIATSFSLQLLRMKMSKPMIKVMIPLKLFSLQLLRIMMVIIPLKLFSLQLLQMMMVIIPLKLLLFATVADDDVDANVSFHCSFLF